MKDFDELQRSITAAAWRHLNAGDSPEQVEAWAAEQEASGFGVTASYTRLLASTMRHLMTLRRLARSGWR